MLKNLELYQGGHFGRPIYNKANIGKAGLTITTKYN